MSWTLFKATFHQRRASIFWFCTSLVLYSWLMTWFWPQLGGEEYQRMIESLPPEFLAIFGGTEVPFASLGGYFQTEYLGLMWIAIVASAVVLYSARAIAGEVGAGTLEIVMAQPISRARFALTRIAVLVAYVLLLAASSFVPIQVVGRGYDVVLSAGTFWSLFGLGSLFMLAVGGFALFLSAMFRDAGKPAAIAAGVLVVMWVADLVSNVSPAAEVLDPVNLVTYWQPGKIINGQAVGPAAWWVYAGVAVASLIGSVIVFARRDVA